MASLNVVSECVVASLADVGCVLPSWFELVDVVSALRFRRTLAILSSHTMVGSISRRTPWKNCICVRYCSHCHRRSVFWFGPREDHSHRDRSCVARLRDSPSSRPSLSVCFSSVVSTCPSSPATACVAVHSTTLATTGQLAQLQGCWGGVGSPSRAPSPRFTRREAHACQRTCSRGIWISDRRLEIVADRLSQFGRAQLTQLWFQPCVGTAPQGKAQPIAMALPSSPHTDEVDWRRSPETANFLRALAVAKAWDVPNILHATVEVAWFLNWLW